MFRKNKWRKNVPLKNFTSFRIGGKAQFFVQVFSEDDLKENVWEANRKKLPIFILGGGTNILVSDRGFLGLVIKIAFSEVTWQEEQVLVGSGVPLPFLVEEAKKRELSGMEWGVGIPGTLGGAVRGNAGTKKETISQRLEKVEIFNQDQLKSESYFFQTEDFGYRKSIFQKHPEKIITRMTL